MLVKTLLGAAPHERLELLRKLAAFFHAVKPVCGLNGTVMGELGFGDGECK